MSNESTLQTQIKEALKGVDEPELEGNLVSLNMIRDLSVNGSAARFTLVLTTPVCPYREQLRDAAQQAVLSVAGIDTVDITLSAEVSADTRIAKKMNLPIKNVIAVSSGKGGVGKSTVSANIAIALAQSGAKVGLMDADVLGPNLPMMLGVDRLPPADENGIQPAEAFGVKLVSMGFIVNPDQAMIWRGPMLHSVINQFLTDIVWGELDYLVADLPPGTGDAQLSLAQIVPLTGAVIVTQPQEVALSDALRGIVMFEKMEVPVIGIVENMSGAFFGEGGGARLAQERGLPFLGSIPLESEVRVGGDAGKPIVATNPESAAAQALMQVAGAIAARISVLNATQGEDLIPLSSIS